MINETTKKRFNAFWQRDSYERCILFMGIEHNPPEPGRALTEAEIARKWTDLEYRAAREPEWLRQITHYGEGFESIFTNFGPGCLAACIGGDFIPAEHTIWFDRDPIIKDWEDVPQIRLDMQSRMWKLIDGYTRLLLKNSNGEYLTSITDIGGVFDIIASLRGTEQLLFDLYDYPQQVAAVQKEVQQAWAQMFQYYSDLLLRNQDGMTSWMPLWCKERYFPLQCDFSAMISPDMFEEWVLPGLQEQTEMMEHSVYHLDGPGELPHLELLLSLPRLDGIQWVPGDGQNGPMSEEWFGYYERIFAAGKNLVLMLGDADGVEQFLRWTPRTKGLFIQCTPEDEQQARELIRLAETVGVK